MPQLRFEDLPSTVTLGEAYNVAVLLESDDGEPMADLEGVQVKLEAEAPHSAYQERLDAFIKDAANVVGLNENVEISFGEGIFELIFHKPAPCPSIVLRASVVSKIAGDVEVTDCEGDIQGIPSEEDDDNNNNNDGGSADEELSDISQIISRLNNALLANTAQNVGPKVKHYLMLIKGRMWNAEGNSEKMKESKLIESLLNLIETAPTTGGASVEAVLEALNVLEEILVNKYAQVLRSCSSCRALIRPGAAAAGTEILSAGNMGVYHASCLRCRTCHESVHTSRFVRAMGTMAPHHVKCALDNKIPNDEIVLQCNVVVEDPASLSEESNAVATQFWKGGLDQALVDILTNKTSWMKNEYVQERAQRVALHVGKAEAGPKEKREEFVKKMSGK